MVACLKNFNLLYHRHQRTLSFTLDTNLLQITTVIFTHKLLTFRQQLLPSSVLPESIERDYQCCLTAIFYQATFQMLQPPKLNQQLSQLILKDTERGLRNSSAIF